MRRLIFGRHRKNMAQYGNILPFSTYIPTIYVQCVLWGQCGEGKVHFKEFSKCSHFTSCILHGRYLPSLSRRCQRNYIDFECTRNCLAEQQTSFLTVPIFSNAPKFNSSNNWLIAPIHFIISMQRINLLLLMCYNIKRQKTSASSHPSA